LTQELNCLNWDAGKTCLMPNVEARFCRFEWLGYSE
jgi:hypothetical protein